MQNLPLSIIQLIIERTPLTTHDGTYDDPPNHTSNVTLIMLVNTNKFFHSHITKYAIGKM